MARVYACSVLASYTTPVWTALSNPFEKENAPTGKAESASCNILIRGLRFVFILKSALMVM